MSLIGQLLDEAGSTLYPQLTFLAVKPIVKEMCACPNDQVMNNEIKRLSDSQLDALMKVVYCCLANDSKNSPIYFKWHAAVFAQAGSGSILRVLTDKAPIAGSAASAAATPLPDA